MTTITTGEDNMADIKIPQQEEISNLNQGGVNAAPKPSHSPSSSGGSLKSLETKEKSYQNQEALPKLSGKILGNLNDTIKDIGVNPIVNYAKKAKGAKVNPDLTLEDVKSFIIKKDTLSVENPGVWDTPVSSKLIKECSAAFKEGAGQDSCWFLLSTASSLAVKKPRLVGFWDRSSAFSLAKTISSIKRIRRDFTPFSDCLYLSMFKESSKESGNLLHQGHLHGEDIQSYKQALQVSESCPRSILEEINIKTVLQTIGQLYIYCIILSPPSLNVFAALAGLIRIKNREWKTSILISKKISLPRQRLFSWGQS